MFLCVCKTETCCQILVVWTTNGALFPVLQAEGSRPVTPRQSLPEPLKAPRVCWDICPCWVVSVGQNKSLPWSNNICLIQCKNSMQADIPGLVNYHVTESQQVWKETNCCFGFFFLEGGQQIPILYYCCLHQNLLFLFSFIFNLIKLQFFTFKYGTHTVINIYFNMHNCITFLWLYEVFT